MKNATLLATLLGMIFVPLAEANDGLVDPGSSVALLNESVVFYVSFDRARVSADLAVGDPEPKAVEGTERFVPGRFGRALLLGTGGGGARVTYSGVHHFSLDRPGALSFWVRPARWRPGRATSRGYVVFVRVAGVPGSFVVERMGFDRSIRRPDRLIVGTFDLPSRKRSYVEIPGTEHWGSQEWHLIVVNWDRFGFEVSLDGRPFERRASPGGFDGGSFTADGRALPFVVGGASTETSAIDDLTCYAHPLGVDDVARLYSP